MQSESRSGIPSELACGFVSDAASTQIVGDCLPDGANLDDDCDCVDDAINGMGFASLSKRSGVATI